MYEFFTLQDIQKMFVFHPLKTYRLFSKYRQLNKLPHISGWVMRDNELLISVPQFITLLEADGYKNFLIADEIERHRTKRHEIIGRRK